MSWKIYRVVPPDFILNKPQNFQFSIVPESINENNLFLVSPKEESVTDSLTANEKKGTFISLIELAEDSGKTPLNFLRKSIRLHRAVFVRLKGQGSLTIFDEINAETKEATFKEVDLKNQLWELPESELEQMLLEQPTEEIKNDGSQLSSENQVINKTKKDHIFVEGKRKPHTAYAVYAKTENRIIKPSHAWRQLGQYADLSKGDKQIDLPGWGLIYLKRDREKSKLRYKNTKFDAPSDGEVITIKSFNSSWQRVKIQYKPS